MPRIRTLKPEHKQHRKVGMLTDRQYRLWVGMITEADDEGRLVADAHWLRGVVFPFQPEVAVEAVADDLTAIEGMGLIHLYRIGETLYAHMPSWSDHQRIDRPQASNYPIPSCCGRRSLRRVARAQRLSDVDLHSTNVRRLIDDHSTIIRRGSGSKDLDLDLSGSKGSKEKKRPHREEATAILGWLNDKAGKNFEPTDANLGFIEARLAEGKQPWQLRKVVTMKCRDWKDNPEMRQYLRPSTVFNKTKCDQYIGEIPKIEESV